MEVFRFKKQEHLHALIVSPFKIRFTIRGIRDESKNGGGKTMTEISCTYILLPQCLNISKSDLCFYIAFIDERISHP